MAEEYTVVSEPSKLKFEDALNDIKERCRSISNVATTTFKDEEGNDCIMYTAVVIKNY